ncbi:AGAP006193-PA-like protein [Anopheles sinensis]|uniref:AGAP006193-PA-like protein n=1 Tax=Anopheles sinensis TaxID=74873 RepID=A0A084WL78_ANOSI|nr:AGAP006193-PA-like protein [Anopheles sinensis]
MANFLVLMLGFAGLCTISLASDFRNHFDAVHGCLQYDKVPGYNESLEYFATDNFRHIGTTPHSKYIRVGMVGETDGTLRFGASRYPNDGFVWEVYLAGLSGQYTEISRQTRSGTEDYSNTSLLRIITPNIMSKTRPFMFRIEAFNNGTVQLTKDGERKPFLEFGDGKNHLEMSYIAFTLWKYDVYYFYDCPLNTDSNNVDDTVLLKCSLA